MRPDLDLSVHALNDLARTDEINAAARILGEAYAELAGSEVLNRALCAERSGDKDKAVFWTRVYAAMDYRRPH